MASLGGGHEATGWLCGSQRRAVGVWPPPWEGRLSLPVGSGGGVRRLLDGGGWGLWGV